MSFALVVTEPFALGDTRYMHGAEITDPKIVEKVERDFPRHFVRKPARQHAAAPAPTADQAVSETADQE